ncbi:MAG: beta-N-acetylhexosaminidase [Lachnospiraceae bacterium]|nr:beta-N-acetylhexosaminidase [Lachnospiraceae bacterium]
MSEEKQNLNELQQKREARRKRRQRNQILAYSVVIVVIVVLALGILALIHALSNKAPKEGSEQASSASESSYVEEEESTDFFVEESTSEEETQESIEETEPVVVEPTYEEKLDEIVNAAIEVMPLEDKVAGLFLITPELLTGVRTVNKAGETTKTAFGKYAIGGVLLRTQNVKNKESFQTMLTNMAEYSRYPLFFAVEEEGGNNAAFAKANYGTKTSTAKAIAATGDAANAYQAGVTIGTYLRELGITMNLAPVADLANVDKSVMAERSFGDDATTVSEYVLQMVKGYQEQGITPCVKHFPGMGSVTSDPEKGRVESSRSEADIWGSEIELFHKLTEAGVPMIMVGNMAIQSLTGDKTPCSLSDKVVTGILRQQLQYDGLVITDMLSDKAITDFYSSKEAAILALKAGCDMILCPESFEEAYEGVLAAVKDGTISEDRVNDSLRRVYRIKYANRVE